MVFELRTEGERAKIQDVDLVLSGLGYRFARTDQFRKRVWPVVEMKPLLHGEAWAEYGCSAGEVHIRIFQALGGWTRAVDTGVGVKVVIVPGDGQEQIERKLTEADQEVCTRMRQRLTAAATTKDEGRCDHCGQIVRV